MAFRPRFIINRISSSLIKPEARCINPIDILRAIRDGVEKPGPVQKADRERYHQLIAEARREYDEIARNERAESVFCVVRARGDNVGRQLFGQC